MTSVRSIFVVDGSGTERSAVRRRIGGLGAMVLAAIWSLAVPRVSQATVVVPLSREELTAQSDFVVRATVLSSRSGWNEDHSQIVTWTRLRVSEYLKGTGPQELVLRQFGGQVDGLESEIPGDARLVAGQHAVLFLRRGEGVVFLTALAQSVYFISVRTDGTPIVRRELSGLSFARWVNGRMAIVDAPADVVETLDQLVRDVRVIVGRRR
jgi:hypothetical protein